MELGKERHQIGFNKIPAKLIELRGKTIRTGRFVMLHLKNGIMHFLLGKYRHDREWHSPPQKVEVY